MSTPTFPESARAGSELDRFIVTSVAGFLALFAFAAAAYPGGTHFDHGSPGHDFWRNTMCDVARTTALDGSRNDVGCLLARMAMTTLAMGLGAFFRALARLMPSRPWLGTVVRAFGFAASLGAVAVVLLPTDRFSALHGLATVVSGAFGLSAAMIALYGIAREPLAPRCPLMFGALVFMVAAVDFALFVREMIDDGAPQVAVAVLERLATIMVLAWMVAVAFAPRPLPAEADRQ